MIGSDKYKVQQLSVFMRMALLRKKEKRCSLCFEYTSHDIFLYNALYPSPLSSYPYSIPISVNFSLCRELFTLSPYWILNPLMNNERTHTQHYQCNSHPILFSKLVWEISGFWLTAGYHLPTLCSIYLHLQAMQAYLMLFTWGKKKWRQSKWCWV